MSSAASPCVVNHSSGKAGVIGCFVPYRHLLVRQDGCHWVSCPGQTPLPKDRWVFVLCRQAFLSKMGVLSCADTHSSGKVSFCPMQTPVPQAKWVSSGIMSDADTRSSDKVRVTGCFVVRRHPFVRQGVIGCFVLLDTPSSGKVSVIECFVLCKGIRSLDKGSECHWLFFSCVKAPVLQAMRVSCGVLSCVKIPVPHLK